MLRHALRGASAAASALPAAPLLLGAGARPGLLGAALVRGMSLWKSQSVKRWVDEQAEREPTRWRPYQVPPDSVLGPFAVQGSRWWRKPELSKRQKALLVKQAIRDGELELEPTVMVPPPKFKGHKRERIRPLVLASIAAKMEAMPRMIAEHKQKRRERRREFKKASRWK